MTGARTAGFTLIEMMVALAIAALLMVLAIPSYTAWMADAQIRNAAESIASGLRRAQAEGIKQNTTVEFLLDPTAGTGGWVVQQIDPATCAPIAPVLQVGTFAEGASRVTFAQLDVTGAAGGTRVTFTGLGDRLRNALGVISNCDGSQMLAEVRITSPIAGARSLNVLAFGGASAVAGQANRSGIKICDPQANIKFGNNDPKACPT
jgi:type IV fimbrial biogenesis protein FimT